MKKGTPLIIVFNTPISSCKNYEYLMWWQNWVNTNVIWKFLQYLQSSNPTSVCPYTATMNVKIRIACSMAEKLIIPREELALLLNNISWHYAKLVRDVNKKLQSELPF